MFGIVSFVRKIERGERRKEFRFQGLPGLMLSPFYFCFAYGAILKPF